MLKYCSAYVEAIRKAGIAVCAKHFPGDGVDFRNQHLHPTYYSIPADQWYASYGEIYKALIDQGLLSIVAGHIVQPYVEMEINPALSLEECKPATLSHELLTGVLRQRNAKAIFKAAKADVMIPLEIVDWTLSAYVRDSCQLNMAKAIIEMGHFNTEELGMKYMLEWLPEVIGVEVPLHYVQSGDSFSYILRD